MTPSSFTGIWPALLTPLTAALDIDAELFARHAKALLAGGCNGVTPFGTTGEGPSFSVDERRAAVDGLIAAGVPADRILVSTSCAALPDAVELTRHAVTSGAFGVLLLPPFFLKNVPDQGVIDAYRFVIDRVADERLRVVLYNIPQIGGVTLSHAVIRSLCNRYPQTIIGLKDSGCQRAASLAYAEAFLPGLQVWVGNEPDLQVLSALGSCGAISGIANVMPRLVQRLVSEPAGPNSAREMARIQAFLQLLGGYGMTAAFKAIMSIVHGEPDWRRVRPPLVALDDDEFERLRAGLQSYALNPVRD